MKVEEENEEGEGESDEDDDEEGEERQQEPGVKNELDGLIYVLRYLKIKMFLQGLDEMIGSVATFFISVTGTSLIYAFAGGAAPVAAGIIFTTMCFWRWTVHTTDYVLTAAAGGAATAMVGAQMTGSYVLAGGALCVAAVAVFYGIISGSWASELARGGKKITSRTTSKKGSRKASRKGSQAGDGPGEVSARDAQMAELTAQLRAKEREVTERDNRLREIEMGAARGRNPNADVHVENTGGSPSGNFAALSNFAVGGTKAENVSGPYTVTGEYAGLKGPPTREPLNQPAQSGQSSHYHHPQATPINMPARLSDLAASSGSAPGMGGGGYALPVNMMTPRYGTHGGSPGAPPTSGAGNPLVNMNAIHVLYCAICNAMCSNPDHHRQMREAGATAGLNPQPPGACPPPRAAAAGSPGGGGGPVSARAGSYGAPGFLPPDG
jgi:hypothetical protein